MAWIALNPQNDGVRVDERPSLVIEIFGANPGADWIELHDRGRPLFVDPRAVYAVYADEEEIEKEINLQLAATAAEREGLEASIR